MSKQQRQRLANAPTISTVPVLDVGDAFGYGRDRRDSSGKTFRVVVPKKLLLWVGLIFFGLPIFLFLYMEGTRYYLVNNSSDFQTTKVSNATTTAVSNVIAKNDQGKQQQGYNENMQSSISSTSYTSTKPQTTQEHPDMHINDIVASASLIEDNSEEDDISEVTKEKEDAVGEEEGVISENTDNETLAERMRR